MKRKTTVGFVIALALFFSAAVLYAQQSSPAQPSEHPWNYPMMSSQGYASQDGWICPRKGRGMAGGMMHHGYGKGHGQMHGGQGPGPCYSAVQSGHAGPLKQQDARKVLTNYIEDTRNPNLKVGEITEKDGYFEATIVTKEGGALVDRIQVERNTGWFRSIY